MYLASSRWISFPVRSRDSYLWGLTWMPNNRNSTHIHGWLSPLASLSLFSFYLSGHLGKHGIIEITYHTCIPWTAEDCIATCISSSQENDGAWPHRKAAKRVGTVWQIRRKVLWSSHNIPVRQRTISLTPYSAVIFSDYLYRIQCTAKACTCIYWREVLRDSQTLSSRCFKVIPIPIPICLSNHMVFTCSHEMLYD